MRIASGVTARTTTRESANALATSASAGNLEPVPATGRLATGVRDHVVDRLVERSRDLPRGQLLELRGVRLAAAELLEALAVGGLVRDQAYARAAARPLDHTRGELDDRDLHGGADVEDVAERLVAVDQERERVDGVRHVHEAAPLRPGAVHR